MPKVTVYIRTEDYDLWRSIDKKTEFISIALGKLKPKIETSGDMVSVDEDTPSHYCEHLAARGLCKYKTCKFSMFNPKNRPYAEAMVAMDANQAGGIKQPGKADDSWQTK